MVDYKAVAVETGGLEVLHVFGGHRGVCGLLKDSELEREKVPTLAPSLHLHNLLEKKEIEEESETH